MANSFSNSSKFNDSNGLLSSDSNEQRSIRIEAEQMNLDNYLIESSNAASDGKLISLFNASGTAGSASTQFSGPSGIYDIVVGYYDEQDGEGQLELLLDGVSTDRWTLDQNLGSSAASSQSFSKRTISGQSLRQGETITIEGIINDGEFARVDYIEFLPTSISGNDDIVGDGSDTASLEDLWEPVEFVDTEIIPGSFIPDVSRFVPLDIPGLDFASLDASTILDPSFIGEGNIPGSGFIPLF
ncbi:MAG: hypothetical protein F6K36_19260 [Symploca sp. SIO3C6]|nr:hypothetical protein [Symploca sp. SIO3C6]